MRLLVLGARRTGLLAAARARGCHVTAVDRDPRAAGFRLAHRRAILEPDDELALERLAAAGRIEGVLGTGQTIAIAARLAARFRLPHPISPETGVLVASRLRQRLCLADAGVPQTRWAILRRGTEPGFPATVGPVDRKGRRLAEEACSGAEVTVTAWSSDGVFTPLLGGGPAARLDGPRVVELRTEVGDREAELCRLLLGIDVHALALDAALGQPAAAEYVRFGTADAQVA